MDRIRTAATATAVRGQLAAAALGERVAGGAQRRVELLREEPERGAQAAEYAMLGGVSAAACGGLVIILKQEDTLGRLVTGVVGLLLRAVRAWF